MGIWVRSQEKSVLINATDIWTEKEVINATSTTTSGGSCLTVGVYDTPEEAIKVLDMIQNSISDWTSFTGPTEGWGGVNHGQRVIEMPPAGFSKPACPLDLARTENYPCSRGDCDCDICKDAQGKEE